MERHKDHISQQRIAEILRHLIDAIAHCHARGVIHRDIKQENVMFSTRSADSPVKLIDFGNSLFLEKGKTTEGYAGTTFNAAPEIERGERYDHKADIFSIGVMCYLLISGGYPFGYSEQGYQMLLKGEYYKCKNPPFCDNSAKLISKMITSDPNSRLTAAKCRRQAFLKLDADHPSSKQAILARHKGLMKTTNDKKKRLEIQNRIVESLKMADDQEDLLDNIVALEAWMVDFQAETKSFSKSFTKSLTKSLTKSASSLTDGLELSAPTITTIENFYLDLKSNGFNLLAENVREALKDDLEYTINLDEVLLQLRDDLEGIHEGPTSPSKPPVAVEGGKPMPPGEMPPHLVVVDDEKAAVPDQMPAHLVIVED
uniref:Protein kinase domain-containing protein n=1 Tax=Rhodosorus marinus TaxID=101924 RepID=A0A7S0BHR5_9RHOD|mmetsp:Transcript_15711/g.22991  ORF Transcript_15711/g.22991 Transcript_15711/m.22991 type:complete len:371 (+) Transcript_15711:502-1614(+)